MAKEIAIYGNRNMIDSQKDFVNTLGICGYCRFDRLDCVIRFRVGVLFM